MRWERYAGRDVIPLWVADTDFRSPAAVRTALARRAEEVLGYTAPPEALREAIVHYLALRHAWRVDPAWIVFLPGVVPGLHLSARRLLQSDEHAIIPIPVYHHFKRAVELAPRPHAEVPLVLDAGRWVWDLDALRKARTAKTRVLYLCNPHNPGSTVFARAELAKLAELGCVIVSDEIHCDLVLDDVRHVPIASLSPEISRRTVTLMSANKAFNFPAAGCAWAVIEDPKLRDAMSADVRAHVLPSPSVFGYEATLAALRVGGAWLAAQLEYLRGNRDLVERELPLPMAHVQATYLSWIDARSVPNAHEHFLRHGVALSPGEQFGAPGFVRLNFGTQRDRLREALRRMTSALKPAG
ncbi:MAG TPA: aminotransferase class I/II-fold pyridoxal phosphate-dependent enzyme [Burkholderiales bacterium]|nr:aminotransferase class I/II-fold pyridoxal phosphate-dependent enzyme [Burkholderiales bacterium]